MRVLRHMNPNAQYSCEQVLLKGDKNGNRRRTEVLMNTSLLLNSSLNWF